MIERAVDHMIREMTGKGHLKVTRKGHLKVTGKGHIKVTGKGHLKVTGKGHIKVNGKEERDLMKEKIIKNMNGLGGEVIVIAGEVNGKAGEVDRTAGEAIDMNLLIIDRIAPGSILGHMIVLVVMMRDIIMQDLLTPGRTDTETGVEIGKDRKIGIRDTAGIEGLIEADPDHELEAANTCFFCQVCK